MIRRQPTITEIRAMPFDELCELISTTLARYDSPEQESQQDRLDRLSRTIEEVPELYRWLNLLESRYDEWTDGMRDQFGQSSREYKEARERRDLMKRMASAAKMRYEAASRLVTILMAFDPTGMPAARKST